MNGKIAIEAVATFGNGFSAVLGEFGRRARMPFPDADRPVDILHRDLAGVLKANVDPVADAFIDDGRNADAAGLGQRFETGGDIDAVAVNVVALDDDVAEIDADPQNDFRLAQRFVRHKAVRALHGERAMDGIDDAAEFHDRAVADQLDDAPVMGGDRGIEYHLAVLLERGERALLVDPHKTRIADHVGREDRRELTVDAFFGHGRQSLTRRNPTQRNAPF